MNKFNNEKDVKKKVKALLDRFGWFWWMPPANGFGKAGISDFNAIWSGTFIAIETKFGSNKPTPSQIGYLNSIRAADGFGFVVTDKNLEWLEAFLESFQLATTATSNNQQVPPEHGSRMLNALKELSNKLLDTAAPPATAIEATRGPAGAIH